MVGLNLEVPLPIQLLFVLQELLWEVFCRSQREGVAEVNPLLAVPLPHSYFICSLFKIRICKTCDVGCALSPHMPFPNQTLAFRTGFVTPLHTLWSDVLNPLVFGAEAPVYFRGPGMLPQVWCGPQKWRFCPGLCSQHCVQLVVEEVLVLLLTVSFAFW